VDWSYAVGLQLVLSEGMSCWGRIRLRWQTRRDPLLWREVKARVPQICLGDSENQNESGVCSAGTQTLIDQRPWMSLGDIELFLQGWFQAQRCLYRIDDIAHQKAVSFASGSQARQSYAAPSSSAIDQT
jgi:hypothetical protein